MTKVTGRQAIHVSSDSTPLIGGEPAPPRLSRGSVSYSHIPDALTARQAGVHEQRDLACPTELADQGNHSDAVGPC